VAQIAVDKIERRPSNSVYISNSIEKTNKAAMLEMLQVMKE
jgi:hypothetical protein